MQRKFLAGLLTAILMISSLPTAASAEPAQELKDESIYDLLVDRFFNKQSDNDFEANSRDINGFSGGDFGGITNNLNHIQELGFTMISIGPVFATATYDGKQVLDYSQLDRHFGTEEEFEELLEAAKKWNLKVIIDVPTQTLSPDHTWMSTNPEWFIEGEDGTVALDTTNEEVQTALTDALGDFIMRFKVDGLRLQTADQLAPEFIRSFSASMKGIRDIYVIGDSEMEPVEGLDLTVQPGLEEAMRKSLKNFDQGLGDLPDLMEESGDYLIQVDSIFDSRFTADVVDDRGYPPTRWNVLMAQFLTMPGVPVFQYGSEIAMNGATIPESHQIMDLSVDEELSQRITDLNSLRNKSAALRTGDIEILHAEDDWLVYKRFNDEESWIIAVNNSSSTKSLNIPAEVVGDDKEMRGLFENDIVRVDGNGEYRITLDREIAETYHVKDSEGLNIAYIMTLIIMYITFVFFLWFVWKKGRQRKADEAKKKSNA